MTSNTMYSNGEIQENGGYFPYCSDPLSQEFHRLFIRMVFEVLIEGKNGLHTKPVD